MKLYFSVFLQHREQLLNKLLYAKGDPLPLSYPPPEKLSDGLRLVSDHNVVTYILVGNGNFTMKGWRLFMAHWQLWDQKYISCLAIFVKWLQYDTA